MQLVEEFFKLMWDLLKRLSMVDANSIDTPTTVNSNLERNENGKDVELNKYKGMIGSLLYLTASRPDIVFIVCICS